MLKLYGACLVALQFVVKGIVAMLGCKGEWVCGSYRRRWWIGLDGTKPQLYSGRDGTVEMSTKLQLNNFYFAALLLDSASRFSTDRIPTSSLQPRGT